ncbi:energy transducer TonB [Massilia violaceinigra]|uniref:peptidylprolyl isomerase n=1 Tax=Massilia violaceinigra TaxID=2045208 RepID=A0ABY4A470_9BURK|nr:energy transducer TonB [Massilia violaceinigra]UOD29521.1 energy transducer TonB [Massilia violaceinigra]
MYQTLSGCARKLPVLSGTAAVLLALAVLPSGAAAADLAVSACAAQVYPAEALRYRMEGVSRVQLVPGKKVRVAGVVGESGYAVLDSASVALATTCTVPATSPDGTPWVLTVPWKLPAEKGAYTPARLAVEFCSRSNKLIRFPELDGLAPNITVRVLVDADGAPSAPKIELSSGEPLADQQALEMVAQCRFGRATLDGVAVPGAVLVPLAFDSAGVSDDKLRALYTLQTDPKLGPKDYKLAQIDFATETEAKRVIGELNGGTTFVDYIRKRTKLPEVIRRAGQLGWMRVAEMEKGIAEAIEAQGEPGLLQQPVQAKNGRWHVIDIEETRPVATAGYEKVRATLKRKLIEEREVVVQQPPPVAK